MYKEIIKDFQADFESKKPKKREIKFPFEILNIQKIITFIWPRRAWKTYFMFYILEKLIEKKEIELENIVFLIFLLFRRFRHKKTLEIFWFIHREPLFWRAELKIL